jgi:hypothetical protein
MIMQKLCPFDKKPCITKECMAWSGKENLDEVAKEHPDSFNALIQVIALQECCSDDSARKIIEMRNDHERCKLITPEPVI